MKKILNIFAVMLLAVISTSCLEHDLEELEVYSGCDITGREAYIRYISDEVHPGTGENKVVQKRLAYWSGQAQSPIDKEKGTAHLLYSLKHTSLTDAEREAFTESNLVMVVTISPAATIKPLDGAPELGKLGDWSKPNKYLVTAADGTTKEWTITIECGD